MGVQEHRLTPVRLHDEARQQIESLNDAHPEWTPWLSRYERVLEEMADPRWRRAADAAILRSDSTSDRQSAKLDGAIVPIRGADCAAWLEQLMPEGRGVDAIAALEAACNQDHQRLEGIAAADAVDLDALGVIVHLATMPLLRRLRDRVAGAALSGWGQGFCPVCGAWPVMAELRGLDRSRWLRCGRCGQDWELTPLWCAFCGNQDHRHLGSLVSENDAEARRIETCEICSGYVKTFATLRAWDADQVPLIDLQTVELDLAAQERGFERPAKAAVNLRLRLVDER
jgi:FdhE protein